MIVVFSFLKKKRENIQHVIKFSNKTRAANILNSFSMVAKWLHFYNDGGEPLNFIIHVDII